VNKKPPELPNIEDSTLRACLAPLMEAMQAGTEPVTARASSERSVRVPAGSNDNPAPPAELREPHARDWPDTLAAWRLLADDEFGAFRTIDQFLAMSDAERETAAAEFPRQIGGTIARLARMKRRLAGRYDTVTTALALLHRAMEHASEDDRSETMLPSVNE
jgi:hypothetical protein